MDKKQRLETQRKYRRRTRHAAQYKYQKTKKGFLCALYNNMRARVLGKQPGRKHLYEGLEILDRPDFYKWALANPDFHRLFEQWEISGYERRLTPSVDRIDSRFGYFLTNMEFIPCYENCKRGAISRWHQKRY